MPLCFTVLLFLSLQLYASSSMLEVFRPQVLTERSFALTQYKEERNLLEDSDTLKYEPTKRTFEFEKERAFVDKRLEKFDWENFNFLQEAYANGRLMLLELGNYFKLLNQYLRLEELVGFEAKSGSVAQKKRDDAKFQQVLIVPGVFTVSGEEQQANQTVGVGVTTIVFDLDETLISNRGFAVSPILRPGTITMLEEILKLENIRIILWTASTSETVQEVFNCFPRLENFFSWVIYRDTPGWFTSPSYTKDLSFLFSLELPWELDVNRIVIFDNHPECLKLNPEKAVLVHDFNGDLSEEDHTHANMLEIILHLHKPENEKRKVSELLLELTVGAKFSEHHSILLSNEWKAYLDKFPNYDKLHRPAHGTFIRALKTKETE